MRRVKAPISIGSRDITASVSDVCSGTAVGKKRLLHLRQMPKAKLKLLRPYHLAAAGLAVPACHTKWISLKPCPAQRAVRTRALALKSLIVRLIRSKKKYFVLGMSTCRTKPLL
jgi:hypothetical protein